jgi:hypothetical protein
VPAAEERSPSLHALAPETDPLVDALGLLVARVDAERDPLEVHVAKPEAASGPRRVGAVAVPPEGLPDPDAELRCPGAGVDALQAADPDGLPFRQRLDREDLLVLPRARGRHPFAEPGKRLRHRDEESLEDVRVVEHPVERRGVGGLPRPETHE